MGEGQSSLKKKRGKDVFGSENVRFLKGYGNEFLKWKRIPHLQGLKGQPRLNLRGGGAKERCPVFLPRTREVKVGVPRHVHDTRFLLRLLPRSAPPPVPPPPRPSWPRRFHRFTDRFGCTGTPGRRAFGPGVSDLRHIISSLFFVCFVI